MMDWARNMLGVTSEADKKYQQEQLKKKKQPQRRQKSSEETRADAERLIKKKEMDLMILQAERQEICDEIALESSKKVKSAKILGAKLKQRALKDKEIERLAQNIDNLRFTQKNIDEASANLEQATIMKDSAAQIGELVEETEAIDLDGIVDDVRDGVERNQEYSNRLSEPIFSQAIDSDDEVGEGDVSLKDELAMLMAGDPKEYDMPDAPNGNLKSTATGGKVPTKQH